MMRNARRLLAAAVAAAVAVGPAALASDPRTAGAGGGGNRQGQGGQAHGLPEGGPPVLYAPPADAPQLQNTGVWRAEPLLVSGASAYRDGEFLYQDYLYDDHGAGAVAADQVGVPLKTSGAYTYPTATRYVGNLADLVEVRVKPLKDATAVRLTYNSMTEPSLVAATIGLGGDAAAPRPMPHGAGATAPADVFVTVHGAQADVVAASTGAALKDKAPVRVDRARRQVEIRVPYSAFDPRRRRSVGVVAATGLWDEDAKRYAVPMDTATATRPGGATGPGPHPAFFNVAFRYDEPFNKLVAGGDGRGVPASGFLNRIHARP